MKGLVFFSSSTAGHSKKQKSEASHPEVVFREIGVWDKQAAATDIATFFHEPS